MAKPRNKLVDWVQYVALRVFAMLVHMWSVRSNYLTARFMGDMMYRFDKRHRRRAMEHLRRSFPEWSNEQLHRAARESMRNMVYLGLEFLFTTRLITPGTWRRHVELKGLGPAPRLLLEGRSGMILLTGHFGNWEVIGYTMAALGFPTVSVARRLDNPYIDRYVMGVREAAGQHILDKKGASGVVPGVLESHGTVAFIADQDAGRKGAFVDFFGRKASTYKIIALMAMQYRVPIVIGYGRRLGLDFRFEIGVHRVIEPGEWDAQADPVAWITQEYSTALEEVIRLAPEQYLWVHRRWKHRPKGEVESADGVG